MRKSIASRFFSVMSMVLVFSIGTLGIFFVFFANRYFQTDRLNLLNLCVTNAQAAFSDSLQEKDGITTEAQRSELRENLRLISNTTSTIVILADENGKCIVCTQEGDCTHEGAFLPNETMKALGSVSATMKLGKIFEDIYSQTSQLSVGRAARDSKGNIIGYVLAFSDATNITIFSNAIISIFMVCAGTMLTISSVVSIIVTSHLTTPLRNISDAARRFSQGDFGARVDVEGDDEVAQLATTFNRMASFVEKNEKSRSSFVANIAHELRTPMTSIKGFVDGMLDGTIPPAMQERYLTVISDEVGRLARLTNSMLDISKLESGEFKMNVANYNIWDTIAAIAFAFENRIEENNITLRGFTPEKIMVNADKDLIHQVVYNIFDNALKFTPQDGCITFSVTEDKSAGKVTVKIRNTGMGIGKEALPYIFERFYKEDSSRSVHTKGAGIGLYISKTLVRRSGGDIWAESEEGKYTEFIFTVPAAKTGKQQQPKVTLPGTGKNSRNRSKNKK